MPEPCNDLQIGDWRFSPALNRLLGDDSEIQLEPKAAGVLAILAERAGELVSRQELLDSVWAGTVVSDDALTQVIIKLRKAFGDSSRKPSYVRTIPKKGYCLVAPVSVLDITPESPVGPVTVRLSEAPLGYKKPLAFGILALVLFAWFLLRPSHEPTYDLAVDDEASSIAVLPFEATSESEREQRFARGIAAELNTDLSALPHLWVINTTLDSGQKIAARYVVTGNVQQAGEHLDVHVRLLETATQRQLWSQRYAKPLRDLFEIQRTISRDVTQQLSLKVSAADMQRLARRYTPSLQAYEAFLNGQSQLLLRQQEANSEARYWYRQAIEADPNFARAYAGLALSHAADYRNRWVDDGGTALQQAQEMAQSGAQIDPNISEVYWVLGYVAAQKREHDSAIVHLEKALELDRSYADAYALMGGINTYRGKPGHSVGQLRQALRLNQTAGYLYYLLLGRAYFFTDQYEQALINLNESLARNPVNLEARIYLMATALMQGDQDGAEWQKDEIQSNVEQFDPENWLATYPMTDQVQIEKLRRTFAQAGF